MATRFFPKPVNRFTSRKGSRGSCPEGVLHIWLGWGTEGMSGHYDQIKTDVAFRKDVVARCEVGFDIPVSLASIEPNEPKPKVVAEQERP
jgi:hypothetical protein